MLTGLEALRQRTIASFVPCACVHWRKLQRDNCPLEGTLSKYVPQGGELFHARAQLFLSACDRNGILFSEERAAIAIICAWSVNFSWWSPPQEQSTCKLVSIFPAETVLAVDGVLYVVLGGDHILLGVFVHWRWWALKTGVGSIAQGVRYFQPTTPTPNPKLPRTKTNPGPVSATNLNSTHPDQAHLLHLPA